MDDLGKDLKKILELERELAEKTAQAGRDAQTRVQEARDRAAAVIREKDELINQYRKIAHDTFAYESQRLIEENTLQKKELFEKLDSADKAASAGLLSSALERIFIYEQ